MASEPTPAPADPEKDESRVLRGRIIGHMLHGNAEAVADAKRDLAAYNIAAAIQRRLEGVPPLTPSQIETLTGLLHSNGAGR